MSPYPNGERPTCGSQLHGDGYRSVLHCEHADPERVWECEPDARPVLCGEFPAKEDVSELTAFVSRPMSGKSWALPDALARAGTQ